MTEPSETPDLGATTGLAAPAQRSRRRRLAAVIVGLVVLVAVVAAGLAAIRSRANPATVSVGLPPATSATATVRRPVAAGPAGLTMVYLQPSVTFADDRHGFVLLKLCPNNGPRLPTDACPAWIASTADGGANWQPHPVLGATFRRDYAYLVNPPEDIFALDVAHIAFLDADLNYRVSADGGSTWTTVPDTPTAEVTTIATNAHPTVVGGRSGGFDLGVLEPDGSMARLRTPPARITGFQRATDGSLWFSGATVADRQFQAVTSRDSGRTWSTVGLPTDATLNDPATMLLTHDGHTLYLLPSSGRVWRSRDGGQHWESLRPLFAPSGYVSGALRLDGSLFVADTGSTEVDVLEPVADNFTKLAPTNGFLPFVVHGARYLSTATSLVNGRLQYGTTLAHSADGITWTEIPYPPASI